MDAEVTFRSQQRLTQEEFYEWLQQLPPHDIHHYELIHGRIVMTPPAGFGHGSVGSWLTYMLWQHVEHRDLGLVLDASTGYDLPSGDTLEPDVSFVSKARLAAAPKVAPERFARVVPDLVVEILSPSTARRDRTVKKDIYAANGVREYWIVDQRRRSVIVFRRGDGGFDGSRVVAAGPLPSEVLPDLALTVEEVFRL
jgi:Uma2 family endonuclease